MSRQIALLTPEMPGQLLETNQLQDHDRPAHDWYRFVLAYPPHLVRHYLADFGLTSSDTVLDPFCGTGTTLVECKKNGIPSIGVEANLMAQFAGTVKVNWDVEPEALRQIADQIATQTTQDLQAIDPTNLRSLSLDSQKVTVANSISPIPLHKSLVLLDRLQDYETHPGYPHLRLALAKALVSGISNLRFRPEVGRGKTKDNAPVIETWLQVVRAIATDLTELQHCPPTAAQVLHGDARQLSTVLPSGSIEAVITSPPYPNEKDYTRTTRLESVLLGFIQNRADLRTLKQGLLRSNSRNVYVADRDDEWVAHHPAIQALAQEIENRRLALGNTSGFARLYPRAVKLYFGGMAKHLADLRPLLQPGAQLAYVVGDQKSYLQVMIRTGQLLVEIATDLGYQWIRTDLFRTRLASVTQEQMREEVIVLRWPG